MSGAKKQNEALIALKKSIKEGDLGQLYLFYGEEAYLRDYYLGEMKKRLLSGGLEEFNLHTFQGKEFTAQALAQAVDCLPMMSSRTLILVYDYDLMKAPEEQREKYIALFQDLPEYVCIVFVYDVIAYKADARTKLYQALKAKGSIVQFTQQEQSDLVAWIKRRFKAEGKSIDSAQAEYLIFLCGGLMTGLISEIAKIAAYTKGPVVTRGDIDAVASPVLDAVVFRMTDAMTAGDYNAAASILGELYQMGQSPIMILSVLGRQLRQLYTARLALEAGKNAAYVAEVWGMRNAYPAQKLMQGVRRYSAAWCRWAVESAAEADLAMKSSGRDPEEILVDLVLLLANGRGR